ncbi:DUF6745 domain-containing protein [Streptomyces sp. NRRL S-350]|uniref:DUF6745 domain-containing protein n=1 Tax=Streptomyces sp. NRRL S-350 TaxID=1463902 RepID=UPI000A3EF0C4|nr:hypothetical protein [Streptomyces sp. NRRL S-350]
METVAHDNPADGRTLVGPSEATARWRAAAAAVGPGDRVAAERAVRAAYRMAGLPEPGEVRWFGSPLAAAEAAMELRAAGAESVREAVRTRPWEEARRRAVEQVGASGWAAHWALTGGELGPVTTPLADRVRNAVLDRLAPEADREADLAVAAEARARRTTVRLALLDAVRGQHDAPWFAAFEAAGAGADAVAPLAALAGEAGWWWPYREVALISERPTSLHRDEAGRLDRADGPALEYSDGFALHAWRGMPVPAEFLAGLAEVTVERIRTEENAELRRVLLEHYGYERYLADSGAEPIHRDETGVLWRIVLPDDEPVVMVEVVNSTPEPDGTYRTYWLRVPPSTRTARAGVAWTFGIPETAYHPQRET